MASADTKPDLSRRSTPGVMSECCGAFVKEFRMKGVRWFECIGCGAVIEP